MRRGLGVRLFGAAFACLGILSFGPVEVDAAETRFSIDYGVYLNGLPLGRSELNGTFQGQSYDLSGSTRLTGLAGAFMQFRAVGRARGAMARSGPRPDSYSGQAQASDKQQSVQMSFGGNRVTASRIRPARRGGQAYVTVQDRHLRNVIDPISAMVLPANGTLDASVCDRTLPLFNGRERFDIRLSYKATRNVQVRQMQRITDRAIVCRVSYKPISGHREGRREIQYYTSTNDIEVWIIEAPGLDVYLPYRISLPTPVGTGVLQMNDLQMFGVRPAAYRD